MFYYALHGHEIHEQNILLIVGIYLLKSVVKLTYVIDSLTRLFDKRQYFLVS